MNKMISRAARGVCAVVLVWSASGIAATPDNFKTAIERDDYETALLSKDADPAALCEYGTQNARYQSPGMACRAAYESAMKVRRYIQATRYAALGCEAFRDQGLCQALPKIPRYPTQARTASK